ncbi:MAG: hypothetical protein A2096_06865 [Spirochaetes bacterium GWF1_41_5]|nr:MAG: hypothetical protein A2096_06865 [Spirochaetes bacterium GWF1_41_5]
MDKYSLVTAELLQAGSFNEVKNIIDSLALSGGYREISALLDFFYATRIPEEKIYVIETLGKFSDYRGIILPLIEISLENDDCIKIAVLKAFYRISDPGCADRVFEIWRLTRNQVKKKLALKILTRLGLSGYSPFIIGSFSEASASERMDIIEYLLSIRRVSETPEITGWAEQEIIRLAEHESREAQGSAERQMKIFTLLLFLKKFGSIGREQIHALRNLPAASLLCRQIKNTGTGIDRPRLTLKKLISGDESAVFDLKNSDSLTEKIIPLLKARLEEYEKHYTAQSRTAVMNMARIDSPLVFSLFISFLPDCRSVNLQKIIIDCLPLISAPEEMRTRAASVLIDFFNKSAHSRIYDSLVNALVTLKKHEGIKTAYDFFTAAPTLEQKSYILSGLKRAVLNGFIYELLPADHLLIELIIGESITLIQKEEAAHFTALVLWFASSLRLDAHAGSLIELAGKKPEEKIFFRTIITLRCEEALKFIKNCLKEYMLQPAANMENLREILLALLLRPAQDWVIPAETLHVLLKIPGLSKYTIAYITENNIDGFAEEMLKFFSSSSYQIIYYALQYFKKHPDRGRCGKIYEVFSREDHLLKKEAAEILLKTGTPDMLESIVRFYLHQAEYRDDFPDILSRIEPSGAAGHNIAAVIRRYQRKNIAASVKRTIEKFMLAACEQTDIVSGDEKSEINIRTAFQDLYRELSGTVNNEKAVRNLNTAEVLYGAVRSNPGENYDYFTILNEYYLFVFDLCTDYIRKRMDSLFSGDWPETVSQVFKNEYNYLEYIRKNCGTEPHPEMLGDLIKLVIAKNSRALLAWLNSLDRISVFFMMTLHEDAFYAINNPLGADLFIMRRENFLESMLKLQELYGKCIASKLNIDITVIEAVRAYAVSINKCLLSQPQEKK